VIRGGRDEDVIAGVRIAFAPPHEPPFPVEAMILEEDTYLVLSAGTRIPEEAEHPIRVMTALWEAKPRAPGSVVVRPGLRTELLAVVHDLDADPTWREAWVEASLEAALAEVGRRQVVSLGTEALGSVHGRMKAERFRRLLREALVRGKPERLERVWVVEQAPGERRTAR
jgi:hypothetical protein